MKNDRIEMRVSLEERKMIAEIMEKRKDLKTTSQVIRTSLMLMYGTLNDRKLLVQVTKQDDNGQLTFSNYFRRKTD